VTDAELFAAMLDVTRLSLSAFHDVTRYERGQEFSKDWPDEPTVRERPVSMAELVNGGK
jgi:hypothetical protein